MNKFILRTPLLSIKKLIDLDKDLFELFEERTLKNALFIASQSLYDQINELKNNDFKNTESINSIKKSLYKYYTRLTTRCTPFGFFAGITLGEISQETIFKSNSKIDFFSRIDMGILFQIYYLVSSDTELNINLQFDLNNTLYEVGGELRFVVCKFNGENSTHELISVEFDEILREVKSLFTDGPIYFNDLVEFIKKRGYNDSEIIDYLGQLINSQIIVSELYPNATGNHYQLKLFEILNKFNSEKYSYVNTLFNKIINLDNQSDLISLHKKFTKELIKVFPTLTIDNLLQIDILKNCNNCSLSNEVVEEIKESTKLLLAIQKTKISDSKELDNFKSIFFERYENALIPLSIALDSDIGINYNLITDKKQNTNPKEEIGDVDFIMNIYRKSLKENKYTINLKVDKRKIDATFNEFEDHLSSSLSFMGSLIKNDNSYKILYNYLVGPTATSLIGRFCYLSKEIEQNCMEIAAYEEKSYNGALLSEINHLPEGRSGNIICRPHIRKFEVSLLSNKGTKEIFNININDLWVGVSNDRVILYSKTLNKEIIPYLSSAHNFANENIPLYKFLCDLNSQGTINSVYWSWDILSNEPFLPRVEYGNTILSPAIWNIKTKILRKLNPDKKEEDKILLLKYFEDNKIPNMFLIGEGDNKLLINVENSIGLQVFMDTCMKESQIMLTEFIFNEANSLDGYVNEIVVPILGFGKFKYEGKNNYIISGTEYKNIANSNWLYYKIYTGKEYSNTLLIISIKTIIGKLKESNIIDKWFFIRFADPEHHLRIRIKAYNKKHNEIIISLMNDGLELFLRKSLIWNIQIDTYNPEIERYGVLNINNVEEWFYLNSEFVLEILPFFNSLDEIDQIIHILIIVNLLLDSFGLTLIDKQLFTAKISDDFMSEFNLLKNKVKRQKISKSFRESTERIDELINDNNNDIEFLKITKIYISNLDGINRKVVSGFPEGRDIFELYSGLIHLFVNRISTKNSRYFEMLIYIWLNKYLIKCIGKNKYKQEGM